MSNQGLFDVELTIDELALARRALRVFARDPVRRRLPDTLDAVALAERLGAIASGMAARAR